jgi:molybdenum cofactor biosynthesis enzyme MoaA
VILSNQTLCLVNHCNLSCTYCWYETGLAQYPGSTLDVGDYAAWFARCRSIGPLTKAVLSGGEPTLRPDFAAVLELCRANFPQVVLITNGTTMTNQLCEALRAHDASVHVSIDHVSDQIADRVRGGTSRALRALQLLARAEYRHRSRSS